MIGNKEQNYIWCMNECIRKISRQHSPIDDYSRCINACNSTQYAKKVDILTIFT